MTGVTDLSIDFEYDASRRRVKKSDASQTSYTMYSSGGKLLHKKVGGVSTDYIYAGDLLVAEKTGSTVDYMHTDLLGSPIAGSNGTAYKEHYRPWGEKKDHPIQLADDVGFTGHQNDVATGLTYMQARYYDPVVGRFMAVDPVQFGGDNPSQFGRLIYANNNPYKYTDPSGEAAETVVDAAFVTMDIGEVIGAGVALAVGHATGNEALIEEAAAGLAQASVDLVVDGAAMVVPFVPAGTTRVARAANSSKAAGRHGKQKRLREIANDDKASSADRGWIRNEIRHIENGDRKTIRLPRNSRNSKNGGSVLAHKRGKRAKDGHGYDQSVMQDTDLHKLEHKYEGY